MMITLISLLKVLAPNNSPKDMIHAKRMSVPQNPISDKENIDHTGSGRGSRAASKNAKARIKVIL